LPGKANLAFGPRKRRPTDHQQIDIAGLRSRSVGVRTERMIFSGRSASMILAVNVAISLWYILPEALFSPVPPVYNGIAWRSARPRADHCRHSTITARIPPDGILLAPRTDIAMRAPYPLGQADVGPKTPSRPADDTNPDFTGDALSRAGSPRNPRLSNSFLLGPMRWYGPLLGRLARTQYGRWQI
jgi:hypothetical protein